MSQTRFTTRHLDLQELLGLAVPLCLALKAADIQCLGQ